MSVYEIFVSFRYFGGIDEKDFRCYRVILSRERERMRRGGERREKGRVEGEGERTKKVEGN